MNNKKENESFGIFKVEAVAPDKLSVPLL